MKRQVLRFPNCTTVDANCSGTIYDAGGPSAAYSGNEDYTYTISPANASSVTINFSAFDLETNFDSLYIYDGNSINAPLIGVYTGMNSPGTVSSTAGDLTLHFISDPFVNNAGFAATWTCTQISTGIDEGSGISNLNAFPNPFTDEITINYSLNKESKVEFKLIDVLGREIILFSETKQQSGEQSLEINFKDLALAKGIYTLQLNCNNKSAFIKLVSN